MEDKSIIRMFAGFLVLAIIFSAIERIGRAVKDQKTIRRGFWTDLIYWFFTPLVTKSLTRFAVILPAILAVLILGVSVDELKNHTYRGFGPLSRQPVWLQGIEVFILGDLIGYWTHRLFHRGKWWSFHAVHHSSVELDWLSSVRLHPVNDLVSKMAQIFPLLFLGFNPYILAAYAPILSFYAILLHANVNWTYGPLRSVIASPVFHRWHHTKEAEAMDKNFAGFFPFIDIFFGTYYMPKDKVPTVFGIDDHMPENLVGQLAYPFKRTRRPVPEEKTATASGAGGSIADK